MSASVQAFRDRVLELLDYNSETGIFTWKTHRHKARVAKIAGWIDKSNGYVRIYIDRKRCYAHRLAWLIMTHKNPISEIDHIDNNKTNNAFSNLREATRSENERNKGIRKNNTSGFIGVYWDKSNSNWRARIWKDKVTFNLGSFESPRDAAIARDKAAIRLHGEFSRLNFNYIVDEEGNVELNE